MTVYRNFGGSPRADGNVFGEVVVAVNVGFLRRIFIWKSVFVEGVVIENPRMSL